MQRKAAAPASWIVACALLAAGGIALAGEKPDAVPAEAALQGAKARAEAYAEFCSALRLLRAQDNAGALERLQKAIELDPMSAPAWFFLGSTNRALGKLKESAENFRKACELRNDDFRFLYELGRVEFLLGNEDEAIRQWEASAAVAEGASAGFVLERLARVYEKKGDVDKAIAMLDKAMRGSGRPDELGSSLAEMQRKAGKTEDAIETYRYLLRHRPRAYELHLRIAAYCEELKKWPDALAEYDALLDANPATIDTLAVLLKAIEAAEKAGKPEKVQAYLDKSIEVSSRALAGGADDARAYSRLATLFTRAGEMQKAIDALKAGIERAKGAEAVPFHAMLAQIYGFESRPDDAEAQLLAALALNPQNAELRARLGRHYIDTMQFKDAADSFARAIELSADNKQLVYRGMLADVLVEMKQYDKAEEQLLELLKVETADKARLQAAIAKVRKRAGEFQKAIEAVENAIAAGPENPVLEAAWRALLAECHTALNQHDKAKEQFEKISGLANNPEAAAQIGYMLYDMNHHEQAIALIEGCIGKPNVSQPLVRSLLCRVYQKAGKVQQAEEQLAKMAEEQPNDGAAFRLAAQLYVELKKWDEAAKAVARSIELAEEGDDKLSSLLAEASVLNDMGRNDEAERKYKAIAESDSDKAVVNNNFGYFYAMQGTELETALQMVKKALQQEPDNGAYLDTFGWVLFRMGDYKGAAYKLHQAFQRHADPVVAEHLGDALLKLGRTQEAIDKWEYALENDPNAAGVAQKIEQARKEK